MRGQRDEKLAEAEEVFKEDIVVADMIKKQQVVYGIVKSQVSDADWAIKYLLYA